MGLRLLGHSHGAEGKLTKGRSIMSGEHFNYVELSHAAERYGEREPTREETIQAGLRHKVPFTCIDRGTLFRIALALEAIVDSLDPVKREARLKSKEEFTAAQQELRPLVNVFLDGLKKRNLDPIVFRMIANGCIPSRDDVYYVARIRQVVEQPLAEAKWERLNGIGKVKAGKIRAAVEEINGDEETQQT